MSNIKFSELPVAHDLGYGDLLISNINTNAMCRITADDITMADGTSLKEINRLVQGQENSRIARELLAKREAEEKAMGVVAVALTGAGAIANKNPVISRRFWTLRRG